MSKLKWDESGQKFYETGVKKGVFYPVVTGSDGKATYPKGYAWNGLKGVTESPSGAEETALYADDIKYMSLLSAEEFGCTIEAYMYPEEFALCDGTAKLGDISGVTVGQQNRKPFGLSYVTTVGNDTAGSGYGSKIHLIYGCMAQPSEKSYESINDSPDAVTFSWEVKTTPVPVSGDDLKPTATLTIETKKLSEAALTAIENVLYGEGSNEARLPLPDEIIDIINTANGNSTQAQG